MGALAKNGFVLDERIPYYLQLKALLEEKLDSRELSPGDKLPSEAEICDELGVSRTVVRQALMELEHEGRVVKKKGKGTFISEAKIVESFVQQPSGFYEDMTSQDLPTRSEVLRLEAVTAAGRVAKTLRVRAGAKVILLRRLRFVGEDPIQLVSSYLPQRLCPEVLSADFREQSLYRFLEQRGIFVARGLRMVEAVRAGAEEAKRLGVPVGSPMIRIESIVYTADGTPVEYYEAVHRGDRTRFRVELVRQRTRPGRGTLTHPTPSYPHPFGVEVVSRDSSTKGKRDAAGTENRRDAGRPIRKQSKEE